MGNSHSDIHSSILTVSFPFVQRTHDLCTAEAFEPLFDAIVEPIARLHVKLSENTNEKHSQTHGIDICMILLTLCYLFINLHSEYWDTFSGLPIYNMCLLN